MAVDLSWGAILTTRDGQSATVREWCDKIGVSRQALRHRLNAGEDLDVALREMAGRIRAKDMTDQVFDRLRVLHRADRPVVGSVYWTCLCDPDLGGCGTIKEIRGNALRSGQVRSCGCLRSERFSRPDSRPNKSVLDRKAEGMVRFNTWVHRDDRAELRRFAADLRQRRRRLASGDPPR